MLSSLGTTQIREVTLGSADYRLTLTLRQAVLLDPFGIPLERACADDARALHLAAFDPSRALGCLLLVERGSGTWQLRQMAVVPELQRRGLGQRLVEVAWERAREAGCVRLWANAREPAVPFYLKAGFAVEGDPFEEVGLPHRRVVMTV